MKTKYSLQTSLRRNWLTLLIAAQPLLDALAYFLRDERFTPAGLIRLAILPVLIAAALRPKPRLPFLIALSVPGAYALLHMFNDLRLGPISLSYDLTCLLRVLYAPLLCLCLIRLIRDGQTRRQAIRGLRASVTLTGLFLLIARLTGTGNCTYGPGLGFSGWVIDDNRCAGSILLVTLAVFAIAFAAETENRALALAIPAAVTLALVGNGTKACYYGLFVIFLGFSAFLAGETLLKKQKLRLLPLCLLLSLSLLAGLAYPATARCRMDLALARAGQSGETEEVLAEQGIDLEGMSPAERYQNPKVRAALGEAYRRYMSAMPDLLERFGVDRVLLHYNMTTDVSRLIDSREIERSYARLIWEDSDVLTRLVGFESSELGFDGLYDLENDGHALFYCYGFLGFALYTGFVLVLILRILRQLRRDFRGSFTLENVSLALCLGLQLGLAQFSGALVRRPNVSFYLALVLAMIWYKTRREEGKRA